MKSKKCFKCSSIKPIGEFYKHSKMSDGHLNKCKVCCRLESDIRYKRKIKEDDGFSEYERNRAKEKYYRLGYRYTQEKPSWRNNSKYKNLHRNLFKSGLISKNESVHHWNYNDLDSYFILPNEVHRMIHTKIRLDHDTLCFFDDNGLLLDTINKHLKFIRKHYEGV